MMQTFTFKCQNRKGAGYLALAIFAIPFGLIVPSAFLLEKYAWIFWLSLPVNLFLIGYFIYRFIKASRLKDTISVGAAGFTSAIYGFVRYDEIIAIPPYGPLQAPPPSMRIKLANGKTIVWYIDGTQSRNQEDAEIFTGFRASLLQHLKQTAVQKPAAEVKEEAEMVGKPVAADLVAQLEQHKTRDYKYIAIPVSLLFAVVMLFRTCGGDFIQQYKDRDLRNLREGMALMETDYENNLVEAQAVIADYTRQFGAIHVYTNDPAADVRFLPDLPEDPYAVAIDVVGLRRMDDNLMLEKIIAHPDSVPYQLVALHAASDFFMPLRESIFQQQDSSFCTLYLAVYNADASMPSRFANQQDSSDRPLAFSTSIALRRNDAVTAGDFANMDFGSVRAILKRYPETQFYMVAAERDGISAEQFEQAKALVATLFAEQNIDVRNFSRRRFNVGH